MTNALHLDVPAGVPWIDFTREFDAPVAAVFEAHRDPAMVVRWLGPHGYEMVAERWDFVSGGGYRYVHRDPEGNEYWFRGMFHTIRENAFLWFEGLGGGRTRLRGRSVGRTVEGRDAMVASGMEQGMSEGYDRLDALAAG
jgi:uncharacterized protein YndB with AHSA1/START domain